MTRAGTYVVYWEHKRRGVEYYPAPHVERQGWTPHVYQARRMRRDVAEDLVRRRFSVSMRMLTDEELELIAERDTRYAERLFDAGARVSRGVTIEVGTDHMNFGLSRISPEVFAALWAMEDERAKVTVPIGGGPMSEADRRARKLALSGHRLAPELGPLVVVHRDSPDIAVPVDKETVEAIGRLKDSVPVVYPPTVYQTLPASVSGPGVEGLLGLEDDDDGR